MPYVPAVVVLMIMYMTSLVGLTSDNQRAWYLDYVPFCIIINALFLIIYHKNWDYKTPVFMLGAFATGFSIEFLATSTNAIYGPYELHERIMGFSIFNIPVSIGLYWFILLYSSASLAGKFSTLNKLLKTLIGTLLTVFLALFILPIGDNLDFWSFPAVRLAAVPYFQYGLIWATVAVLYNALFHHFKVDSGNKISVYVYGGFTILFIGLWMFLKV